MFRSPLQVASVHEWTLPPAELSRGFTNNSELASSPYVPHKRAQIDEANGAVVLHYAVDIYNKLLWIYVTIYDSLSDSYQHMHVYVYMQIYIYVRLILSAHCWAMIDEANGAVVLHYAVYIYNNIYYISVSYSYMHVCVYMDIYEHTTELVSKQTGADRRNQRSRRAPLQGKYK